jgi:CO/xanthine dehydrogenase Mo-binding subunit
VKVILTREEEFTSSVVKHPCTIWIKTGVKNDGQLVAREIKLFWDTGAYSDVGPHVSRNTGYLAAGPYVIPHVSIDSYCIYTNKPIAGGYRGFGVPQVTWAYESQMDMIAHALGIDPLEIRLINSVEEGSPSATGEILHSVGLKEALRKAAELLEWKNPSVKNRGRGIACMHKNTSTPSSSSAMVKINEDGTVTVMISAVDMGQGIQTVVAQVVSEELGIPIERIQVVNPDTDMTPYERSTSSSRATFHTGNAVKAAAIDARNQILEMVGQLMGVNSEDLTLRDGKIMLLGSSSSRSIDIEDAIRGGVYMAKGGRPVVGRGVFSTSSIATPLDPETGQSPKPTAFWMYAAQAAEVEVDTETGQVQILKMTATHDVGKAINPLLCEQQIEGALAMGIGGTLYEEQIVQDGKTLNPNFVDYKLPTSLDIPAIVPCLVEAPHELGPYGAKGLGEPGLAPTAAAISNAIYDAIGVRIKDLPITPERILKALGKL